MKVATIVSMIIMVILGALLASSVLVPVVDTSTQYVESVETDQPNVQNYMSKVTSFTMTQESDDYSVTLDGEELSDLATKTCLVVTDKVLVKAVVVSYSDTTKATMGIWADGLSSATISGIGNDISLTLENGTLTLVYGSPSTTETFTVAYAYVYDPDGDYAAVDEGYTTAVKANAGDDILLFQNGGWWTTTYLPTSITAASGEVEGTTTSYAAGSTTGVSTTITATFTAGDYDELSLSACSPTTNTALVPVTYTDYEENVYGNMLGLILIVVFAGLVFAAVSTIVMRRD